MSPIVLAAPFCWSLPGVLVPFKSKSGGLELSERLLQNNTTYSSCNLKRPDVPIPICVFPHNQNGVKLH